MQDKLKNTTQLIEELQAARARIAELESAARAPEETAEHGQPVTASSIEGKTGGNELEEAQRESVERYRAYFENAPNAMFVVNADGKYIEVNEAACRLTGYTRDELLSMAIFELVPPDSPPEIFTALKKTGKTRGEIVIQRKDGANLESSIDAVALSGGRFMAFCADITERKQAEKDIKASEEKLHHILANSTNLFYSHTPDHVLTYMSPQVMEMLGYSPAEAMIKWTQLASDNPINEEGLKNTVEAMETGKAQPPYELELLHKSGRKVRVRVREAPVVKHGKTVAIVGAATDITERKKAEDRFKDLAEMLPETIFESDININLRYANRRALELFGYSADDLARGMNGLELLIPEDQDRARETLVRRLKGEQTGTTEYQAQRKDGSTFPVFFHMAPILEEGAIIGFRGIIVDITERKQAEEERAKLEEKYRQSQKMEAIGRLAGGVAHDFNNLVCAITGTASLALDDLPVQDPLRESLEEITKAADRAAALTQQLLAFSRKQVIAPKVINLSHLVERMHSMLVRLIGEDIILRTVPAKQLGWVRADPGQIEQVVLNLAINARDAMPDGGDLVIETADVLLDEEYCKQHGNATPGDHVILTVSDTGCGMSAEIREKIFEPFFTTKQLGQGTGLGLATVFGIIEQNEGNIEVYSEPQMGSSFKVYFPCVAEESETRTRSESREPVGGPETVLVVEDEEIVRTLAVRLLEHCSYNVLAAASAGDAIVLAERYEGPIDLLLTDVVMPQMNGRELAERLIKMRPGIKVLYTSGYTQNIIAHHGVLDDGIQFVAKPYSLDSLTARVREVLDQTKTKKT